MFHDLFQVTGKESKARSVVLFVLTAGSCSILVLISYKIQKAPERIASGASNCISTVNTELFQFQ